jgi:hypothetical protein
MILAILASIQHLQVPTLGACHNLILGVFGILFWRKIRSRVKNLAREYFLHGLFLVIL